MAARTSETATEPQPQPLPHEHVPEAAQLQSAHFSQRNGESAEALPLAGATHDMVQIWQESRLINGDEFSKSTGTKYERTRMVATRTDPDENDRYWIGYDNLRKSCSGTRLVRAENNWAPTLALNRV